MQSDGMPDSRLQAFEANNGPLVQVSTDGGRSWVPTKFNESRAVPTGQQVECLGVVVGAFDERTMVVLVGNDRPWVRRDLDIIFWPFVTHISFFLLALCSTPPLPRRVTWPASCPCSLDACWMLNGARDPMLCPIHVFRQARTGGRRGQRFLVVCRATTTR